MRNALSDAEVAFVHRQHVAHLATADASGLPHVVPVCFAYLDGRLYIAIDEKPKRTVRLKRLRNIEGNQHVALVFDHYEEEWTKLGWVLVQGIADVIERGEEHERAVDALRQRYEQYLSMSLEGRPVVRVTVEKVSTWGRLDAS
jgi:PPOX class probable F420-dependent enzyme